MGLIEREQVAGMNCHYCNYSLDYFFESMETNGYKTVALWGGAPHFYLDYKTFSDCKRIKKQARQHGLEIKCFAASSGTYGYQICMQQREQFERCFQYFSNGIKASAELDCTQMSVNSGWGFWNENYNEAWKRSVDMLSRLSKVAESEGITLTMESLRRAESQLVYNLYDAKRMYQQVNSPALKIMIDTTAVGVAGETPQEWFEEFGDEIVNTHFIDGNPYGHLVWGDGNYDLEEFLKTIKKFNYNGLLGLEITDRKYYKDPKKADQMNMAALEKYF